MSLEAYLSDTDEAYLSGTDKLTDVTDVDLIEETSQSSLERKHILIEEELIKEKERQEKNNKAAKEQLKTMIRENKIIKIKDILLEIEEIKVKEGKPAYKKTDRSVSFLNIIDSCDDFKYAKISIIAKLKNENHKAKLILRAPLQKWQEEEGKAQASGAISKHYQCTTDKINAVNSVINLLDNGNKCDSIKDIIKNRREVLTCLKENEPLFNKERNQDTRRKLYLAALILIPVGIGILASLACSIDYKMKYGTFNFLKAKTFSGENAKKAIKILDSTAMRSTM